MSESTVQYPIILDSIFPTFAVHNRLRNTEELEEWLKRYKLEIVSMLQFNNYIVVTAVTEGVKLEERII